MADPKARFDPDPPVVRLQFANLVAVGTGLHLREGRPALAAPTDVLAFVIADDAARGRAVRRAVLDAAGDTDVVLHRPLRCPLVG